ncbi:MAG TPA: Vms1/Ankzf1 family peptidyl-tRNA hydrolase, partial [Micromonosporaceae bacterium]
MHTSELRTLYERPGPWASVYVDASGVEPGARQRLDLRWRGLRERLERDGANAATCGALEDQLLDEGITTGLGARAVFAADGVVGFTRDLPQPPSQDIASFTELPHVAPLVRAIGEPVRWVRADVDRTGGTVTTTAGATTHVSGESTYPISKVSAGGWSMPRYQRAAETNWDRNSADVAGAVVKAVDRSRADVVVVSGDVRARQLLVSRLPGVVASRVVEIDHESPGHYGGDPVLDEATSRAITNVAVARRDQTLDRFRAGLSDRHAVRGLGPVTESVRDQQVETLLLAPQENAREIWSDADNPAIVANVKSYLGMYRPVETSADDALLGAAAMSGANVM